MQETEQQAEHIAAEGTDVRTRIRDLMLGTIKSGRDSISRLPVATGKVLDGAWRGVEQASEEQQAEVFRDVIDGLSDGLSQGAIAVKLAFEEAKDRGQSYAEDDIRSAVEDLRTLESMFTERVEALVSAAGRTTAEQARDLITHARRASSSMMPDIQSARRAAEQHPLRLAKETAAVAADASRRAAGSLLRGIGGMLDNLGDAVDGTRRNDDKRGT